MALWLYVDDDGRISIASIGTMTAVMEGQLEGKTVILHQSGLICGGGLVRLV